MTTALYVGGAIALILIARHLLLPKSDRAFLGTRRWLVKLIRRAFGGYAHQLEPVDESLPLAHDPKDGDPPRVAVIGGGLAGLGTASDLSERGLRVTLFEQNDYLGGKVGAWNVTGRDGRSLEVEHGFHAFFRHYYNLNRFLDRTGVSEHMKPIEDYVILERDGTRWGFAEVETSPVLNLVALARSGLYRFRDILFTQAVHEMDVFLAYDRDQTFAELDGVSYRDFAARAELPPKLRMVFNTFARAFFADDDRLSMAELVKSFHFYYLSHDQGLIYDYPAGDYQQTVLGPIARYMQERGVELRLGQACEGITPLPDGTFAIGEELFDHVVLATSSVGAKAIAETSPALAQRAPSLTRTLSRLRPSQRYAVLRVWLDRDIRDDIPVFVSTEREQVLDSVTAYHRITDQAARRAAESGGSVLELHCYAVPDGLSEDEVRQAFLDELVHYFPELDGFEVLDEHLQVRKNFTAFHVGMAADRPSTETELEGLFLAGDWVRLPVPAMLMEAAYTSGLMATNAILEREGLRPYPVLTVPQRGLLYDLRQKKLRAQSRAKGLSPQPTDGHAPAMRARS